VVALAAQVLSVHSSDVVALTLRLVCSIRPSAFRNLELRSILINNLQELGLRAAHCHQAALHSVGFVLVRNAWFGEERQ